jgi:hypothetical protein
MNLRGLEADFWRAPSAHNTQPWVLRYPEDHTDGRHGDHTDGPVEIGWDPARTLPAGDPTGRDLRLSLGAFTETCLIVCADAGLTVGFRPDHSEADRRIGHLVPADAPYATPFTTADVHRRASNRAGYRPGRLDAVLAAELADLAAEAGGEVRRLRCRELIELLHDADRHLFGTPPIARELRAWLRFTPRDPRYHRDGLTDRALGLSTLEAFGLRAALARRTYPPLRRVGLPRLLAAASKGVLDYEGDVLVLVGPPRRGPTGQITMGRVLMRQWLTLSGHGLVTHPLSQIIDAPRTREALAGLVGVDDPSRLLNIARVGRPVTACVPSPRLLGPVR